jgi:hypothetical protein
MPPVEKPAAKTEHKPDEHKPNPLGNPEAGKAQEDSTTWLKECAPHIPSIVGEGKGPAGGQDSSPQGK